MEGDNQETEGAGSQETEGAGSQETEGQEEVTNETE